MMIDTSPWSSCSRRSPWLPWSSHKISSTGPSVSPFRDFSAWSGRGRGEDCAGILWSMAIVDGGRGGVLGMLTLPMCAGCVVVDGGGGGGVDCGDGVLVMFS